MTTILTTTSREGGFEPRKMENASEAFEDGKHKHGGTIWAFNITYTDGSYERVYLGVTKGTNRMQREREPEVKAHFTDWTIPAVVDGKYTPRDEFYRSHRSLAKAREDMQATRKRIIRQKLGKA